MTTTITMEQTRAGTIRGGRARARALGILGALLANVMIWAVAVPVLGIHLLIRFGTGVPQSVGLEAVMGGTLIAALAGWGLLSMLERRTSKARESWTVIALLVLVASLSLPLVAGTTVLTTAALALMHLAAAAVLIPALRRG